MLLVGSVQIILANFSFLQNYHSLLAKKFNCFYFFKTNLHFLSFTEVNLTFTTVFFFTHVVQNVSNSFQF